MENSEKQAESQKVVESQKVESQKEAFGTRVRRLLEERKLNQTDFALKIGMERSELNRTLNCKRQPRPDEIGWIAQALGLTVDQLLTDVELPMPLRKAMEQAAEAARRVLEAESSRDEALAQLQAMQETVRQREAQWDREREQLQSELTAVRAEASKRLRQVEEQATKRESALRQQATQMQQQINQLSLKLNGVTALNQLQRNQVLQLQRQLSEESGKKALTGIFAGLAGAVIGGALKSSDSNGDDEGT